MGLGSSGGRSWENFLLFFVVCVCDFLVCVGCVWWFVLGYGLWMVVVTLLWLASVFVGLCLLWEVFAIYFLGSLQEMFVIWADEGWLAFCWITKLDPRHLRAVLEGTAWECALEEQNRKNSLSWSPRNSPGAEGDDAPGRDFVAFRGISASSFAPYRSFSCRWEFFLLFLWRCFLRTSPYVLLSTFRAFKAKLKPKDPTSGGGRTSCEVFLHESMAQLSYLAK